MRAPASGGVSAGVREQPASGAVRRRPEKRAIATARIRMFMVTADVIGYTPIRNPS